MAVGEMSAFAVHITNASAYVVCMSNTRGVCIFIVTVLYDSSTAV